MTHPSVQNNIQIDGVSSTAIREEIADRLRIALAGESDRLPRHMKRLVEQMAATDCQPPLVAPRLRPVRPPSRMPIIDKED